MILRQALATEDLKTKTTNLKEMKNTEDKAEATEGGHVCCRVGAAARSLKSSSGKLYQILSKIMKFLLFSN